MWWAVFIAFGALLAGPAHAEALSVVVRDQSGVPVKDAVVTVHPAEAAEQSSTPSIFEIIQENLAFSPAVTVIPKGSTVSFVNKDPVRHHVFSFSKAKRFDLRLFGKDEVRTVDFETAGTVAIGCNIHDNMIAYLRIVETPHAERTDASGAVRFDGIGPGDVVLRVWHPDQRAPEKQIAQSLALTAEPLDHDVEIRLRKRRTPRAAY
jgi:plastocyanin